jgi:hypothetical protein
MGRAYRTDGETRNVYTILGGKPEGKRPVVRYGRRWEDNVGVDNREIGWKGVDWTQLDVDRDQRQALMNTVMKGTEFLV